MTVTPQLPGLAFEVVPQRAEPSPLRSDVAGFIGRTTRGPVGIARRVEGWRGFLREFGGLRKDTHFAHSVRGYFENGGQVAWIVRLALPDSGMISGDWELPRPDGKPVGTTPDKSHFPVDRYTVVPTSPGDWAKQLKVHFDYLRSGFNGEPVLNIIVRHPDEPTEFIRGVDLKQAGAIEEAVQAGSQLIRISAADKAKSLPDQNSPRGLPWTVRFNPQADPNVSSQAGSKPPVISVADYRRAIEVISDEPEAAILALPGLEEDITCETARREILSLLIRKAEELQDRMVVVDVPAASQATSTAMEFARKLREESDLPSQKTQRNAALYLPRLKVIDPLGTPARPWVELPPSGHVAGLISRSDRQRGAHYTPANLPLLDAVDLTQSFCRENSGLLNEAGLNLIRCQAGRGLQVYGGRTLDLSREGRFLAHRRLIHRLVRAIRRVAEPLVFDTNGPALWFALVRAITTVLLEAFRSGALKGASPQEGFQIRCDENTNPISDRENGRVLCEIDIAPAAPMEFITIRIALSQNRQVEVFDQ